MALIDMDFALGSGGASVDLANLEVIDYKYNTQYKFAISDTSSGDNYICFALPSEPTIGNNVSVGNASELFGVGGFDSSNNWVSVCANGLPFTYSAGYITLGMSASAAFKYVTLCKL